MQIFPKFSIQCWQDFKFKIKLVLCWFVLLLVVFSLVRAVVFWAYHPLFVLLSVQEIAGGFLQGIRFDASIITLFSAPLVLALLAPVKSLRYVQSIHFLWCILFVACVGVLIGDFIYFPEAKRHIAEEILTARNEWAFLIRFSLRGYWWVLLGLAVSLAALFCVGARWAARSFRPVKSPCWKTGVCFVLAAGLLFLGVRGHLGRGKPLSIRSLNQFSSGSAQSILMMNGLFSLYHSTRKAQASNLNPMPEEEAWQAARKMMSSPQEKWTGSQYPISRSVSFPGEPAVKNIFVVLLESWTPKYIDSLNQNGRKYGVTPNFDKMAFGSIRFTQAFSVGVRSVFGLTATFAGIPLVSGLPQFSDGLELNAVTHLARILGQRGYYTAFIQSSQRSSYQMCSMASSIFGFEESFGMEDLPRLMDYTEKQPFGYDYDLLNFAAQKATAVSKEGRPFFIFTFTGTTHPPFAATVPKFDKYSRTSAENNYLNTLFYADYAVGSLLKEAARAGWLKDTVFIFMADHTAGIAQQDDDLYGKFRIPFVIYSPGKGGRLAARTVDYPVSQLDLIPTLFHLLGVKDAFSALGNDALDETAPHFAFITEGTNVAFISGEGFIRHDRERILDCSAKNDGALAERLAKQVLALDKTASSLLGTNRWAPAQE